MRTPWWIALVLAAGHFIMTWAVFLKTFTMTMARFDTGGQPTLAERAVDVVREILFFPLATITLRVPHIAKLFHGALGWIPFVLNSLLWGILVYMIVAMLLRLLRTEGHRT